MERLKSMLGAYNGHIKQIEQRLDVKISHRGDSFYLDGDIETVERAEALLQRLYQESEISHKSVPMWFTWWSKVSNRPWTTMTPTKSIWVWMQFGCKPAKGINPRGANQKRYV